jgi:uncharacterized protein (TIGR02996 family)
VSTTRRQTASPDGRFELRYRYKDEWGDAPTSEEDWKLCDGFGCAVAHWTGAREDDDGALEVHFDDGFRAVVARYRDRTARFVLPRAIEHPPAALKLRAALFADPEDDRPRLVYADWLLERGDPRGEMMALAVRGSDAARVATLVDAHRWQWLSDDGLPLDRNARFARGFVEALRVQLFDPDNLARLLAEPAIACLRELDLSFATIGDAIAAGLAACPRLGWLRRLNLGFSSLSDAGLIALATSPYLERLEQVDVTANHHLTRAARDRLADRKPRPVRVVG